MDPLERFQHSIMAAVIKCPNGVPRHELIKTLHETSINTKITLFAQRWSFLFKRSVEELKGDIVSQTKRMTLRSGRIIINKKWTGADPLDFGDMMVTRFEDFKGKDLELPISRDFNARDADKWAKKKKAEIKARINERLNFIYT